MFQIFIYCENLYYCLTNFFWFSSPRPLAEDTALMPVSKVGKQSTNVYKCSQMFPLHNLCSRNPGLPTPVPSHPHYNNAPSPPQLTMVMIMVSPIKHCEKSFSFFKGFLIFQSNTKKRWGTTYRPARFIDASDYYLNFLLICY